MVTGVEDAVVLTDQLVFGKFADAAELVVNIGNRALDVGHGHDGVLVESELLIGQVFEGSLAGGQAFSQGLFRPLSFGDIGADGDVLSRLTVRSSERKNRRVNPIN